MAFLGKKGQLGIIEFKYWFFGFVLGFIAGVVLVILVNKGVIPWNIALLRP